MYITLNCIDPKVTNMIRNSQSQSTKPIFKTNINSEKIIPKFIRIVRGNQLSSKLDCYIMNLQLSVQLQQGTTIFLINEMRNFEIISKVGEGAFASVYKVKRKEDGCIYAMKKIKIANTNHRQITNTLNEVRILASITNPYILAFKDAHYDQTSGALLLITEFAQGGDLSAFIKAHQKRKQFIPEGQIWRIAIQVLYALKTLHKMNIFHRDIKSANLLLTKNNEQIRLGDLNVSKISKSGLAVTQTGTPYYASPQVWSDLPYNGKCDIWSLGCVLYEMASFRPPFTATDIQTLKKRISAGVFDRIPSYYSEQLQSLLRLCLTTNPKDRPTAEGLLHHNLIRKRMYLYPNQKFNESSYQVMLNKQNKLLQTIKVPGKYNFGGELKNRLPRSNYENNSQLVRAESARNKSSCMIKERSEQRLPQIMKRNSSREAIKQKCNLPKPRLVYLR